MKINLFSNLTEASIDAEKIALILSTRISSVIFIKCARQKITFRIFNESQMKQISCLPNDIKYLLAKESEV